MLDVPAMELENEAIAQHQPLVVRASVATLATQETLVPAAARLNIVDADQGLWMHGVSVA
jgi:hypothetical protein